MRNELRIPCTRRAPLRSEGVDHVHGAVEATVLKVLRHELVEAEALGVRPHVRVEPGELISGGPTDRNPEQLLVGIENVELAEELLRLAPRLGGAQQPFAPVEPAGDRRYELDDGLVREVGRAVGDPGAEALRRDALLVGKAPVVAVDEDVRVNERRRARRDPPVSILDRPCVVRR
jgi:hypothetical protein